MKNYILILATILIVGCSSTKPIYSRMPADAPPAPSPAPSLPPPPAPAPAPLPAPAPVAPINLPTIVPAITTNLAPVVVLSNTAPVVLEMAAIDPRNAKSAAVVEVQTSAAEPQSVLPPPPSGPTNVTVSCVYPYPAPAYFEVGMWTNLATPPVVLMRTNTTSVTLPIQYNYPVYGFSFRAVNSNLLTSAWATR